MDVVIQMLGRCGEYALKAVGATVRVKRDPWDRGLDSAVEVPLYVLHGFHVGISAVTRSRPDHRRHHWPMVYGYMSCADLPALAQDSIYGFHSCRHGPPPHSIKVCVTRKGSDLRAYAAAASVAGMRFLDKPLTGHSSQRPPPATA